MTDQRPKEHEYASYVSYGRALEDYCDALEGQQAQPEQEPIYQYQLARSSCWLDQTKESYDYNVKLGQAAVRVVYTSPPQRQPLTDDEIVEALMPVEIAGAGYYIRIARAIEAKLKEKNT